MYMLYINLTRAPHVQDEGWIFATRYFGVSTHYRLNDDSTLRVRSAGRVDGCMVFDQVLAGYITHSYQTSLLFFYIM